MDISMKATTIKLIQCCFHELLDIVPVCEYVELDQCVNTTVFVRMTVLVLEQFDDFLIVLVLRGRETLIVQPVDEQFKQARALILERNGLVACFLETALECSAEELGVVRQKALVDDEAFLFIAAADIDSCE
jgi:hypothetical protein